MTKYYVHNEKTKEVLFESDHESECIDYMTENFNENHEDFEYIWLTEMR